MLFPDGAIYAVGGYDGINYVSSVERLDPRVRFHILNNVLQVTCSMFYIKTLIQKIILC